MAKKETLRWVVVVVVVMVGGPGQGGVGKHVVVAEKQVVGVMGS